MQSRSEEIDSLAFLPYGVYDSLSEKKSRFVPVLSASILKFKYLDSLKFKNPSASTYCQSWRNTEVCSRAVIMALWMLRLRKELMAADLWVPPSVDARQSAKRLSYCQSLPARTTRTTREQPSAPHDATHALVDSLSLCITGRANWRATAHGVVFE